VNAAVERGLAFLISRQDASGFWQDWDLPVGPSRLWTTAYVGWRLATCGPAAERAVERAADWLEANELDGGGWGYSEFTGADADSTALGILFLHAIGRRGPESALQRLLSFRRDDGGFATYGFDQGFGAWTASQVEVTATAALALQAAQVFSDAAECAAAFLRRRRRVDGLWDSYWWISPCYATGMAVRVCGEGARQEAAKALREIRLLNPFDAALRSLVLGGEVDLLTRSQHSDGSWPASPILRLTHRDQYAPQSSDDAGPCFADPQRVFTTATVVSALSCAQDHGEEPMLADHR
jgi:squalene cyclase